MADRHLNLFYTYNRDSELIENNLTRAFIVFLSIVSDEARHKILSALLEQPHKTINYFASVEDLDFTDAHFALQSNIDRHLPKRSNRQLLLTIATEPLNIASTLDITDVESDGESVNNSGFSSVPDAWIYDDTKGYCILVEAKVGTYPLDIGQLQAHARDWFGSDLQELNSRNSLCSATWIDVLKILRIVWEERSYTDSSEGMLFSHMAEFIGYYGYRLFDGFNFSNLDTPPDLIVSDLPTPTHGVLDLSFYRLASPPNFVLARRFPSSQQGGLR